MTFINLLLLSLVNALFIVGVYRAFSYSDEMIFGKMIFTLEKILPLFIQKPLFLCVWCMASVYSIPVYWFYMDFTTLNLYQYLFYIPVVSVMAGYINDKLIES